LGDGNKDQAKAREDEERVECVRPGISPGTSVRGVESPGRAGHGHQSDPRKRHLPDSAERDDRDPCEGQDLAHDRPQRGGLPVMKSDTTMSDRVMPLRPAQASVISATATAVSQRDCMILESRSIGGRELKPSEKSLVTRVRVLTLLKVTLI